MSENMSAKTFLRLCYEKDDDAAVREALEKQPELVHCRETHMYWKECTPLHHASRFDHHKVVRVLLEHGADVNARCDHKRTPLHEAASNGEEAVVRLLLEHGGEVNVRNSVRWTPLHCASCGGHEEVVRLLLEHGADRSFGTGIGETARDVAERTNNPNVVAVLDSYYPVTAQLVHVLLGLKGPTESPLTRLAAHSAFEPKVLSLVKCLLTGEESAVFDQLQLEVQR